MRLWDIQDKEKNQVRVISAEEVLNRLQELKGYVPNIYELVGVLEQELIEILQYKPEEQKPNKKD